MSRGDKDIHPSLCTGDIRADPLVPRDDNCFHIVMHVIRRPP